MEIRQPDHVCCSALFSQLGDVLTTIFLSEQNPDVLSAADLASYYSGINITESLSANVLSIRQWAASTAWNQLGSPVDRSVWPENGVHAYITNARYNVRANQILIPAGISQAPILFPDTPSYLTYGGLGFVAGHDITHGFDSNGRKFNNDRQYKDWWDDVSVAAFENRTRYFVHQFSGMEAVHRKGIPFVNSSDIQPMFVNGQQTLSENIADDGVSI